MSIITFLNGNKEQTGKTMSLVAIATDMAIEHNYKILLVSTTNKYDEIERCFWEAKSEKVAEIEEDADNNKKISKIENDNKVLEIESDKKKAGIDIERGVEGLGRMVRSNKISPERIPDYTKLVFKNRLEVLLGSEDEDNELASLYPEIIATANEYYDLVIVDLDENITGNIREAIIHKSDLIVTTLNQRLRALDEYIKLKEEMPVLKTKKNLILIGRYDKFSKYNAKNITKYLSEKNMVLTIPYNTLFFEASEEAGVPDLFLRLRKTIDSDDRNAIFITEVQRAVKNIKYRLQDLQMKY